MSQRPQFPHTRNAGQLLHMFFISTLAIPFLQSDPLHFLLNILDVPLFFLDQMYQLIVFLLQRIVHSKGLLR